MQQSLHLFVLSAIALHLFGCSTAEEETHKYHEFVLYSLDPSMILEGDQIPEHERFHGKRILGQIRISDPFQQRELLDALQKGFEESDGGTSKCWFPRHGLRLVEKDVATEYVICFACSFAYRYTDGVSAVMLPITETPKAVFNSALVAGGVPLASQ